MIAGALQGFHAYAAFEIPFVIQPAQDRGGALKWNLPRNETRVAVLGYELQWSATSATVAWAISRHFRTFGGHTSFLWTPPPFDVAATSWLHDAAPAFGGGGDRIDISVRLIPA